MHAEKSNFTITRMPRLLGVSRSGYYAWLSRVPSDRALRRERIEAKIVWFHGASDEVSGSPRIVADLRADGEIISAKTVAAADAPARPARDLPQEVAHHHHHRRPGLLPARCGETGLGHRDAQPRLGKRHNLPAHVVRMAVPGHRHRRPLASGDRLGHRRAHARRSGRTGPADGDHAAWRATCPRRVPHRQ